MAPHSTASATTSPADRTADRPRDTPETPPQKLPGDHGKAGIEEPPRDEPKRSAGLSTIVLAIDESEASENARAWAASLAHMHGARLVVTHVPRVPLASSATEPYDSLTAPVAMPDVEPIATIDVDAVVVSLRDAGVRADAVVARPSLGSATEALLEVVGRSAADLLVVGTEPRSGLARALFGSTAVDLLREAPCPVLIVPLAADHAAHALSQVLVPTDLSAAAAAAFPIVQRVLRPAEHSKLVLLTAGIEPLYPLTIDEVTSHTAAQLEELASTLRESGVEVDVVIRDENAVDAIVGEAERRPVDLVVMGTHGRSGLRRLALGSTTEQVVQQAPCPILTVRPSPEARL